MKPKAELPTLKARAQALQSRLFWLERRIRQMEQRPGPPVFKAAVDPGKCMGCGLCEASCPSGAMVVERTARVVADRCIGCGRCVQVCPQEAISLRPVNFNPKRQVWRPHANE